MTAPAAGYLDADAALKRIEGKLFATLPETSAILRYDGAGRTVRKAIADGLIPAVRYGATYRIPVAWIRAQLGAGGGGSAA